MKLRRLTVLGSRTVLWFLVADWIWLFPFFAAYLYLGIATRRHPIPLWVLLITLPLSLVWVRISVKRVADGVEVRLLYIWCVLPVRYRRQPLKSIGTSRSSDDIDHDDEIGLFADPSKEALWLEVYQAKSLAAAMRAAMERVNDDPQRRP